MEVLQRAKAETGKVWYVYVRANRGKIRPRWPGSGVCLKVLFDDLHEAVIFGLAVGSGHHVVS